MVLCGNTYTKNIYFFIWLFFIKLDSIPIRSHTNGELFQNSPLDEVNYSECKFGFEICYKHEFFHDVRTQIEDHKQKQNYP